MNPVFLSLYFIIGGLVVALTTYFGSQAKGLIGAFIAFFPSISVLTLITIYLSGGLQSSISYTRSLIVMTPAWLLYVIAVIIFLPRLGLIPSIIAGITVYIGASLLTMKFFS